MNKLLGLIICLLGFTSTLSEADSAKRQIPFYIVNAASHFDIDADLLYAVCQVESNCKASALNRDDGTPLQKAAGIKVKAYGLFQIQVATAETLGFRSKEIVEIIKIRYGKPKKHKKIIDHASDLLKPEINAYYAAKLIHKYYLMYQSTHKVISAYNAGHPIKSNKDYVYKVLLNYAKYKIDKK